MSRALFAMCEKQLFISIVHATHNAIVEVAIDYIICILICGWTALNESLLFCMLYDEKKSRNSFGASATKFCFSLFFRLGIFFFYLSFIVLNCVMVTSHSSLPIHTDWCIYSYMIFSEFIKGTRGRAWVVVCPQWPSANC